MERTIEQKQALASVVAAEVNGLCAENNEMRGHYARIADGAEKRALTVGCTVRQIVAAQQRAVIACYGYERENIGCDA